MTGGGITFEVMEIAEVDMLEWEAGGCQSRTRGTLSLMHLGRRVSESRTMRHRRDAGGGIHP